MLTLPPVIEPFAGRHDRQSFRCGETSLDRYIQRQASQDVRRRLSRVFVATGSDNSATILGFYTLSAASVEARTLPPELTRKLPKYPLPAALIGRLAVDKRYQRQNLGKYLLMDALARILSASSSIAVYAVVVDAIDEQAECFYEKYGFQKLPGLARRLFIPLKTISGL
jgi:GNAT superfamily N-acetyltransferase